MGREVQNGGGGRQGRQLSQAPGNTAAICRKLHGAGEGEWESESSLSTKQQPRGTVRLRIRHRREHGERIQMGFVKLSSAM